MRWLHDRRAGTWWAATIVVAIGAWLTSRSVHVRTDMDDFLVHAPTATGTSPAELLRAYAASPRAQTSVFVVCAPKATQHRGAARRLRDRLSQSAAFAWVRSGSESADAEAAYRLFFPARWGLIDVPRAADGSWLREQLATTRRELAGSRGSLLAPVVARDPLLAFATALRALSTSAGAVVDRSGQLETRDGACSVVFASTAAPALHGAAQRPAVEAAEAAVSAARAEGTSVAWTSVGRFAVETERRVRREAAWIGIGSTVAVLALYLLAFRSLVQLLAGSLVIALALVGATACVQAAFGSVHALALTFGASLVGVMIDFAAHYAVHLQQAVDETARAATRRMLRRATATGALTTVPVFAVLAATGLPVFVQIAVLGVVGVVLAFVATDLLLPRLLAPGAAPSARGRRGFGSLVRLAARPTVAFGCAGAALVLAVVGLPRWRWRDDASAFKTPLPEVEREADAVARALGRGASDQNVVAVGVDDEQALRATERLSTRLHALVTAGALAATEAPTLLVPSRATQLERRARLAAISDAAAAEALHAEGFVPATFGKWSTLLADAGAPIEPSAVGASSLAFLLAPWRLSLPDGRVGYLTALRGVRDVAAIEAAIGDDANLALLDPGALLERSYARFRQQMQRWLVVGAVLVLLVMVARYRRASLVIAGLVPALLGLAATLGALALAGVAGNVLVVAGVVLVLGLGTDYGVYLVEAREHDLALSARGVALGAATTAASFAALVPSSNAAVRALGLTSAVGVLATTACCPLVLWMLLRRRDRS